MNKNDDTKKPAFNSVDSQSTGSVPHCRFCDDETKLKHGCEKQRWSVCKNHFMVTCPECGHEAFWMEKQNGEGRYCCFAVQPWCNWVSDIPPNA